MKILVGLGNPDKEYLKTRHNAGAICLEMVRETLGSAPFKLQEKFHALTSETTVQDEKVIFAFPQTYMNDSGLAVAALVAFYKCAPPDLWVIYDDLDLPLGTVRIRDSGSAGTHNGMKSILEKLGFQDFPRFRIGIESRGVSAPELQETSSFVLSPFTKKEEAEAEKSIKRCAEGVVVALKKGLSEAMKLTN